MRWIFPGSLVVAVIVVIAHVSSRSPDGLPLAALGEPVPSAPVGVADGARPAVASPASGEVASAIANTAQAAPALPHGVGRIVPSRARLPPGPALSPADAALLEAAKNLERDVWPRGEDRSGLASVFGEEAFGTFLDALEVQMQYDIGARDLAQLFADGARGRLPADSMVQLERLACGMRVCAALFESRSAGPLLPSLGYNSVHRAYPLPDGGMQHRIVFSLDYELHIATPPPGRTRPPRR